MGSVCDPRPLQPIADHQTDQKTLSIAAFAATAAMARGRERLEEQHEVVTIS
jgi:hypothetical protein